jgi:ankyrin repeat protein
MRLQTQGNTPLHLAAINGHCEMVNLLLQHGASREKKNEQGNTASDVAKRDDVRAALQL